ncbi:hypothetical protein H6P81_002736 [Aristolochia fimbriata]|uniref:Gnk2-homologous domain-containing protein n=1 Tax=Aristolochia fimbriata TaxID=158543 RepID=A0AAV7FAU7_ARIFI|nr:hypothetical protein H6P81_002736 [Aristolochia fimbriata]
MAYLRQVHSLLLLLPLLAAHAADNIGELCGGDKNLTTAQSSNLARVLQQLTSTIPSTHFATSTSGTGSDKIHGLAQCRGDIKAEDCSACISAAATQLPSDCSARSDARIWFDYCFLHYSTKNFIGKLDTGYGIFLYNVNDINATNPEKFDEEVGGLLKRVREEAVVPENRGLGKGQTLFESSFVTIYGLVQCNGDLSPLLCDQCLSIGIGKLPEFCKGKVGCQAIYSSCKVR